MRTFTHTLGGSAVTIVAPEVGDFDATAFSTAFPGGGFYGLDVEGTYMTDLGQWDPAFGLRLIQFGTEESAWVLNLADLSQYEAAVSLLRDRSVSFCSHTAMDVLSVAVRLGVDITARNVDTRMLASMVRTSKLDKRDLKSLTADMIGPELGVAQEALETHFKELWDGRKNAKRELIQANGWAKVSADEPRYLVYAGLDAIACRRLAPMLTAASKNPAWVIDRDVWLAGQANRIQLRGMRVDKKVLAELQAEAQAETDESKARIMELTEGVGPQSPKIQGWLAEHGVDWTTWEGALTDTGTPSLAKENVKLLLDYPLDDVGRAVAEQLIRFKGRLDALNKTKGVSDYLAADGNVHPVLNTVGATATARMSSSNPNFQNFSKKDPRMRGLFLPDPGYVLVTIDFDQVELRVVAALAREQKMIDTILAGGDLHQLTVDELAEVGVTITRDQAKIVNFLIVYGGGGKALHDQTGIPRAEADAIVLAHRQRYQAIAELADRLSREDDAVRTISYRRLPVKRWASGEVARHAGVNFVVQSSARELLVDGWHRFATEFGHGSCVWFAVHDELVLQIPVDRLMEISEDAERCMRFDFMGVPISATAELLLDEDGVTSRWMTGKLAAKNREAKGFTAEAYADPERAYMEAFLRGDLAQQEVAA